MNKETKKWINEKITITLSRDEMFNLANAIAEGNLKDVEFTKIKDRKIRKLFREAIEERHRLWLKVINNAQYKKTVK